VSEGQTGGGGITRPWLVYILSCRDGTLYTGITTDLERRLTAHNAGKGGARYTRGRRPVSLVYAEPAASHSAAAQREREIKAMTTTRKKELIGRWHPPDQP